MYTNPRWLSTMMLITVLVVLNSCTEFALLSSGAGLAVSHNTYAKAYNGVDFLTVISTEKDIKTHIYHNLKKENND